MANLVGIDVGLTLVRPTSGVCRTGNAGFRVARTHLDKLSRQQVLAPVHRFDVLAIDGPILSANVLRYHRRPCESVFVRGVFQRRCGPGYTHSSRALTGYGGVGPALRRAGCDTAVQFALETVRNAGRTEFPRIQPKHNVVEAFPNAFLGVLLQDAVYREMPALDRGERFEWLLKRCRESRMLDRVAQTVRWQEPQLWAQLRGNDDHEEQAALVCALTAVCVWRKLYVAVGEQRGGYFFLPPWFLWQPWAKQALDANRRNVEPAPNVWINGRRYGPKTQLP